MGRRNYDRMYKSYEEEKPVIVEEPKIEEVKPEPIKKKSYVGTVIGGYNLNVRNQPNGKVVTSLRDGEKIIILDDSNNDWYKIADGYVMKKFIKVEEA